MRIAIGSGGGFCMESFVKVGRSSMSACLKGSPPPSNIFCPTQFQIFFERYCMEIKTWDSLLIIVEKVENPGS